MLVTALSLVACGGPGIDTTTGLGASTAAAPPAPATTPLDCGNPRESYSPLNPLPSPSDFPSRSYLKEIRDRGRLVAGVSADTYRLGARDPSSNRIEGFDIDMVRHVAQAILGDPNKVTFKVITAADRVPVLKTSVDEGGVDIVARAMTMNCARWADIAFSSQYFQAGQKVLVRSNSSAKGLADLDGQNVCVQSGTTTETFTEKKFPEVKLVPAATATDCLVKFQQGTVDAITSDDTILAGLAAQDPYAEIPVGSALTEEPYGLGLPKKQIGFARFVNGVLADVRSDGRWQRSYDKWLKPELGVDAPPKALYGR
jgi:polar amino acid transport system substrate-binding protein